jgi:hypothetical protein
MEKIEENYQRIKDDKSLFDIRFWQSQGDLAIFEAVTEMLNDYFLIRGKNADESRLQRTIENFCLNTSFSRLERDACRRGAFFLY